MSKKASTKRSSTKSVKELKKINFYKDLIADLIYECRAHAGKNQKDFGEMIGTNQKGVARLESGNHFPRIETLVRIASALDCVLIPPRFSSVTRSFFDGSWMLSGSLRIDSSAPNTKNYSNFLSGGEPIKFDVSSESASNRENVNELIYDQN